MEAGVRPANGGTSASRLVVQMDEGLSLAKTPSVRKSHKSWVRRKARCIPLMNGGMRRVIVLIVARFFQF